MLFRTTLPTLTDGKDTLIYCDNRGRQLVNAILSDSNGEFPAANVGDYETVAASQTDQVLGGAGAIGDYLERLIIVVATAATAAVSIKDGGGSAISVLPNSPGGGVGTYTIPIGARSTAGAWKVTTGAGASVIAVGNFT